jgi:murein DD-endopeptidase MepM/ murein hydrolase activator NlpD
MDFQIILLPRQDYWSWVRACKEYVLKYGPNLTPDPATAARHMAPRQVVTFPAVPDGWAEQGDLQAWFLAHHPDLRLDVIQVSRPADLEEELKIRIETDDRFGQKRGPFHLLWPTDFPVVTQPFGANPQIYRRWGLPGHEGLDIRAFTNSNVYACADGTVYEVYDRRWGHPYGIHVRLAHRDGYKTVYAHLAKALVSQGEVVSAGQVIGKADSTGNSTGSHLHLTLKRDGATERGETRYPKDIIDPTPFMVWPDETVGKGLDQPQWAAGKCLIGANARLGVLLEESDLEAITTARLEAVKVGMTETEETIQKLRDVNPAMFLVARLNHDFASAPVEAQAFLDTVAPFVRRLYGLGVRYFEVCANPNLQVEGWQRTWRNGNQFGEWLQPVLQGLRKLAPEGRFGFPGLSPGGYVSGQRADAMEFLQDADEAVHACDWVGVNCYWTDAEGMRSLSSGLLFEEYRLRHPHMLLMVTEFGNASPDVSHAVKAQDYLEYLQMLRQRPRMAAAFGEALSSALGSQELGWRREDRSLTEIPARIGARVF